MGGRGAAPVQTRLVGGSRSRILSFACAAMGYESTSPHRVRHGSGRTRPDTRGPARRWTASVPGSSRPPTSTRLLGPPAGEAPGGAPARVPRPERVEIRGILAKVSIEELSLCQAAGQGAGPAEARGAAGARARRLGGRGAASGAGTRCPFGPCARRRPAPPVGVARAPCDPGIPRPPARAAGEPPGRGRGALHIGRVLLAW